ncbi:CobW family GTP-binding protein [Flammeovirga aprica]|uniref:Cobalamin biosynthesis protein CobW n=1 Tax=Flammeovirga aprica JL-4 TaxID=694437 RepID=A0A7X9XAT2_9BACT|nr:GTP-binding protein [Flammeovirga aprica]NME70001.1 cobalamin biosynthesis protein CobW [Flammeovirga aprica JL-4]
MNKSNRIPVVVLNGFLGSGKTTLFRHLLAQSVKKDIPVCAIVNDMSELDVDGELLGTTDAVEDNTSILESIHNCLISSDKGIKKLDQAIEKLLSTQTPELIIVETSGSSHPMPLVEYFKDHSTVKLIGMFVLVDSLMLSHDFNYGEQLIPRLQNNLSEGKRDTVNLLVEQIMFCSHVFLTKSDRIGDDKLPHIASFIKNINPFASTHSLRFGKLDIEAIQELEEYDYFKVAQLIEELKPVLVQEKQEDRPYNLATRVLNDDRPFHPQRLWNVCHEYLDQRIYRSKGFFWLATRDQHSLLWNQAAGGINLEIIGTWRAGILEDEENGLLPEEIEHLEKMIARDPRRFGDRHCDLTVIGDASQVDRFTAALEASFLTEEEIKLWKSGFKFEDPWPKNIVKIVG